MVYALVRGWPGKSVLLQTVRPVEGGEIVMLGASDALKYAVSEKGLEIEIPEAYQLETNRPCDFAWVFKIPVAEGAFGKGG